MFHVMLSSRKPFKIFGVGEVTFFYQGIFYCTKARTCADVEIITLLPLQIDDRLCYQEIVP